MGPDTFTVLIVSVQETVTQLLQFLSSSLLPLGKIPVSISQSVPLHVITRLLLMTLGLVRIVRTLSENLLRFWKLPVHIGSSSSLTDISVLSNASGCLFVCVDCGRVAAPSFITWLFPALIPSSLGFRIIKTEPRLQLMSRCLHKSVLWQLKESIRAIPWDCGRQTWLNLYSKQQLPHHVYFPDVFYPEFLPSFNNPFLSHINHSFTFLNPVVFLRQQEPVTRLLFSRLSQLT